MNSKAPLNFSRIVLVTVVKAFLGEIDAHIRAIRVGIEINRVIVKIFHEGELTENNLADLAFVEVDIKDGLGDLVNVEFLKIRIDSPKPLPMPELEEAIFHRKENFDI